MPHSPFLAHGGTAGLALEIGLLLCPIVVFAILAKWSAKKNREETGPDDDPSATRP